MKFCLLRNIACISAVSTLALASISSLSAREYDVEIVIDGLSSPTGISSYYNNSLIFTEVPTPDLPGPQGGENTVKHLNIRSGHIRTISEGEPYPINVAVDKYGTIYWTCQTAGVIVQYNHRDGKSIFLPENPDEDDRLLSPTGITVDRHGDVLFTELPMPGTKGVNMVSVSDGEIISLISDGEPAPTDIVISKNGTAYWTCNTAGVILKRSPAGVITLLLSDLDAPTGIALNRNGSRLYFTEIPTPGVSGTEGGSNNVIEYDLRTGEKSIIAAGFPSPQDVTVGADGTVYWTCTKAGVIAKGTPKDKKEKKHHRRTYGKKRY